MNVALSRVNPLARAVMTIGAVAALVTGITFAALSSSATLTNNTISSASASLTVWNGAAFVSEAPGFTVTDLVPGVGKEFPFYLKNGGTVDLDVTLKSPDASLPTLTGLGATPDGTEVLVTISSDETGCSDAPVVTTLKALRTAPVELPCNALTAGAQGDSNAAGTEGNYKIKFDLDPAKVTGSSAGVGAFNLQFDGVQAAPAVVPAT